MQDVIQLLPDNIANQIAAGEVVQRPASVVKELMENALDAGADKIMLQVKDGGKTLIRVIDNGCGMSPTDARMSFERHATSKIRDAGDLFKVRTMGFRGEALASIAAVAQVELKTRRQEDEMAALLSVHASSVKRQEATQAPRGTWISVKQLFYNVPARRKFLKSDAVELKHIIEEFKHIALAHPDIFFSLYNKENELFHLPAGSLKQRILALLGKKYEPLLLPVDEEVDQMSISGWTIKPEGTKKRKADTYIFVNNRYIKSAYLHHAIKSAYGDLIDAASHPPYVLFLSIDPSRIDVNVHPTKQEVKFEDERLIYHYVRVAVRHALGQYSLSPLIDFENAAKQRQLSGESIIQEQNPAPVKGNPSFRPPSAAPVPDNWSDLYEIAKSRPHEELDREEPPQTTTPRGQGWSVSIHRRFIASSIKDGLVLIHKKNALYRIFYEEWLQAVTEENAATQQELFPLSISLSQEDASRLMEILPIVQKTGFDLEHFGGETFIIRGIPAALTEEAVSPKEWIESLVDSLKTQEDPSLNLKERVIKKMAANRARYHNTPLEQEEINSLIDRLFACEQPKYTPDGKRCFITIGIEEMEKRFEG